MTNDKEMQAAMYLDFYAFVEWAFAILNPGTPYLPNWHIDAMIASLMKCVDGEARDLLITVPPRHLKSLCASQALPAWLLGRNPNTKIICASYGEVVSNEFAIATKKLMTHPDYLAAFPKTRLAENAPIDILRTTAGGYRKATSFGGGVTAFGCDFLIIDDAAKASASIHELDKATAFFKETLVSRHNSKADGVTIVVGQRINREDLPGRLLAEGGWTHLNLPSVASQNTVIDLGHGIRHFRKKGALLHPEREGTDVLEQIRKKMGDHNYRAQYLQAPDAPDGAMFKEAWFPRFRNPRPLIEYHRRVLVIDTATTSSMTSNPSVAVVFGDRGDASDVLHVWRNWADFDELLNSVHKLIVQFHITHVLIEGAATGEALIDMLRLRYPSGVYELSPQNKSKEERAASTLEYFAQKKMWLPVEAPWLSVLEQELFSFPSSAYTDQVDCVVYYAKYRDLFAEKPEISTEEAVSARVTSYGQRWRGHNWRKRNSW